MAIAQKKLNTDTTLIAVAVRGGNYENEWGGNFLVGDGTDGSEHEGFGLGKTTVLKELGNYLGEFLLTHSHCDHYEGLKLIIENFTVDKICMQPELRSDYNMDWPMFDYLMSFVQTAGIPIERYESPAATAAVWTSANDQDDRVWHSISGNTLTVNASSHKNESGVYMIHFYNGNTIVSWMTVTVPDAYIEELDMEIWNARVLKKIC